MAELSAPFLPTLASLLVLAFAVAAASAAREPFAQEVFCKMTQDGLNACKPAITGPKPAPKPTDACCAAMSHADLKCLCSYKNSSWLTFLQINPDLAMQLPSECNLTPHDKY